MLRRIGVEHQKTLVGDLMAHTLITVTPKTSVLEAYDRMRRATVRRLPVVDAQGLLVGIVTRSDIDQAMGGSGSGGGRDQFTVAGRVVEEVMTSDPQTVTADQSVAAAAELMYTLRISGVPVVADGKPVGIITETDIFRLVVQTWSNEGD
jgi:acetoin utilization protein AcuB